MEHQSKPPLGHQSVVIFCCIWASKFSSVGCISTISDKINLSLFLFYIFMVKTSRMIQYYCRSLLCKTFTSVMHVGGKWLQLFFTTRTSQVCLLPGVFLCGVYMVSLCTHGFSSHKLKTCMLLFFGNSKLSLGVTEILIVSLISLDRPLSLQSTLIYKCPCPGCVCCEQRAALMWARIIK